MTDIAGTSSTVSLLPTATLKPIMLGKLVHKMMFGSGTEEEWRQTVLNMNYF
jgi:hypothetical protein